MKTNLLENIFSNLVSQKNQWSMVNGQWSLVTGHWSLVTGHWSLVIGHWSMAILIIFGFYNFLLNLFFSSSHLLLLVICFFTRGSPIHYHLFQNQFESIHFFSTQLKLII